MLGFSRFTSRNSKKLKQLACLFNSKNFWTGMKKGTDIFEAQKLGHLWPLIDIARVDWDDVQGRGNVTEQDPVPEGIS